MEANSCDAVLAICQLVEGDTGKLKIEWLYFGN
jgi:hypothetical protein